MNFQLSRVIAHDNFWCRIVLCLNICLLTNINGPICIWKFSFVRATLIVNCIIHVWFNINTFFCFLLLQLTKASFVWDIDSHLPTLSDINLEIPAGKYCASIYYKFNISKFFELKQLQFIIIYLVSVYFCILLQLNLISVPSLISNWWFSVAF